MRKGLFIGIILFALASLSYGIVFEYDQQIGRKLRFKNLVRYEVYQNAIYLATTEQMNKAVIEMLSFTNGYGIYHGKYYNYEKETGVNETFRQNTVFEGDYYMNRWGMMIVSPDAIIPSTRSIPAFTSENTEIGDTWASQGEEIHQNIFDTNQLFKIPVTVRYEYQTNVSHEGRNLAKIALSYDINFVPKYNATLKSITGVSKSTFYWDIDKGSPYFYNESISVLYTAKNGQSILYKGISESKVEEITDVTNVQKNRIIEEISNTIQKPETGVTIKETNDGIIVNLGNVLFDIDRYDIKKEFEKNLDYLAEILNKYPHLDIEVSGHTDNTGYEPYNTILSENRAKSVSDYLMKKGVDKTRISYKGFGPTAPIADNKTATGRQKNRRVELKIITKE